MCGHLCPGLVDGYRKLIWKSEKVQLLRAGSGGAEPGLCLEKATSGTLMLGGQGHRCGPSILEMIAHVGFSDGGGGRQRPSMALFLASLGLKAGHHGQGSPPHSTVG